MGITWGGSSGYLQLGIDTWMSPGSVGPRTQSVTITVAYYIRATGYGHNFNGTLRMGGRIGGTADYSFYSAWNSWDQKEIARRSVTVSTQLYAQSVTFSASTGPVWNGGTPSVSRTVSIGRRGYEPPHPPRNPLAAWQSDGLTRVTWEPNYTGADGLYPWSTVQVKRYTGSLKQWDLVASLPWNATSWDDVNPPRGEHTEYSVHAVNEAGSAFDWAGSVNTRPLPPTSVRAVKTGDDITVSWEPVERSDGYYVRFHVYDNGSRVATVDGGTRSWTHSAPSKTVAHSYRVSAETVNAVRNTVSAGLTLESEKSSSSNTVQLLARPYAPQSLSPNGAAVPVEDGKTVLSWDHNPADSSTQQSYQVRYRTGGGSWTTVSGGRVARQSHTLSSLRVGRVEWQVRTWGSYYPQQETGASPWSSVASFSVVNRPVVSISSPAGGKYEKSRLAVEWSYLQEQGSRQSGARVTITDVTAGRVVETSTVSSDATRYVVRESVLDGHEYEISVVARSGDGVESTPAVQRVNVEYAKPEKPVVSTLWDDHTGAMSVQIMNPTGGTAPSVVSNRVERSADGGATWELVADGLPVQATVTDPEALSNGETLYRVTATSSLPSSSVVRVTATASSPAMWVGAGVGFTDTIRLPYDPEVSFSPEMPGRETYRFAGRMMRVMVDGTGVDRKWQVSSRLLPGDADCADVSDVDRVALTAGPVCYRNPDGIRFYAAMGSPSMKRGTGGKYWDARFELVEVERS